MIVLQKIFQPQLLVVCSSVKALLMSGLKKVGAEMSLTVLSYNIKRVLNILGVKELITAVA